MTEIMNLNHLAPDTQEDLLFLPRVAVGRQRVHEKSLRPVGAALRWRQQRKIYEHFAVHAADSVALPAAAPPGGGPRFPTA